MNSDTYNSILEQAVYILQRHPDTSTILGEDFKNIEDTAVVINTLKAVRQDGGKTEISTTTDAARPTFEWLAELTFDRGEDDYQHFLLRTDGQIVEAYGRKLFDVEPAAAKALLKELGALAEELKPQLVPPGQNGFIKG